jgi:hypothetical protein
MRRIGILTLLTACLLLRASAAVEIELNLTDQEAYLIDAGEIVYRAPISSGRAAHPTPHGEFEVIEKDIDHRSSLYGKIVGRSGQVIKSDADSGTPVPAGARFVQAPMHYFLRFTGAIGMHAGILPGYPASHGCVRLPREAAKRFYEAAQIGTPVRVYGIPPYAGRSTRRETRLDGYPPRSDFAEPPPVRRVPFYRRLF